ncbi:RES domain protein [Roseovarius gaetbuli]|uniref:RES domain protein n=1 Tax=Roseovarius gaetbuli TaxID=1356575 RepID=A0A1X6YBI3_9RHOB|nr:RES domain-containing protein [Roseovarius gaetbuli]SLN15821.1 RES domain protein [Roseovarius gaetbuli]
MTPLPEALGGGGVWAHRLDRAKHAPTWSGGEGAFQAGGRWNPVGTRAVYCALDPSTAILEVAVHKGFRVLDTQPHVMTAFQVADPTRVKVFAPEDFPDLGWLDPGNATPERRAWGAEQLQTHGIIVIPSAVSRQSWNLIFLAPMVPETFQNLSQTPFVLDPRLNAARG